ncbi:M23 family metallopeptidase [Stigmatella hybrida]|uniref:M23 family metallopeptidase n=1 Tax=Stigmatella hybrida TaxID=394097 RepID=UPI001CDAB59D|nr:M23 family metallopeptidase [Stigmatella hybrida]
MPPLSPARRWSPALSLLLALLSLGAGRAGAEPSLSIQPGTAKPGDPVLITVWGLNGTPTGTLAGRALRFYEATGGWQAISGLPVELTPGTAAIQVLGFGPSGKEPVELTGTLDVVDPAYPDRQLRVAGKYVQPPASVKARMAEDKAAFATAFSQALGPLLIAQNFAWPRQDRITAPYGDKRSFNGKLQSQHFGTDIDGDPGTPVQAANDGVVVMTRDNYSAGNTVILHHGGGLYTTYFHLSRIDVKVGAKVRQGELLGKVGKTGRVTGPHLHWGVKAGELWVDGETLLKLNFFSAPPPRSTPAP